MADAEDFGPVDHRVMRPPTVRTDPTAVQSPSVFAVAERVSSAYPAEVARLRDHIELAVTSQGRSNDRIGRDENLQGPATYDEHIRVAVACSFHPYTSDLGTFPPDVGPFFVRVRIVGRRLSSTHPPLQVIGPADAAITLVEADGWLRAALGDRWADYVYDYTGEREPGASAASWRYGVILDRTAVPMLVPDNFDWSRVDRPAATAVRKITPHETNSALRQYLSDIGPFAATAEYLDPRTAPDGRWRIDVNSRSSDPGRLDAFRALADRLRIRGLVDTRFVPISLALNGRTTRLAYQLKGSPAVYDVDVPVPTGSELQASPSDDRWVERFGYRPPVFPMTVEQWASGLCAFWTEMVAYGRIGDVRAPWARR